MKKLSKEKQELINLAKSANLLQDEINPIFGTNSGYKTILCDDGKYHEEFSLKMIIDPTGEFANMPE